MSKLQDLIQELCPNGVEYKKLGDEEVSIMQRGTSLTKKNAVDGIYPVISGGKEPAFYCDKYNREGETITIAGSGAGAGYVQYWNEPIFVCDAFSIKGVSSVSTKYLYYCLNNLQDKIYSTKKGGGVPHVHISSIDNFEIPIPPLPVQEEIVKILDRFAVYTAELQAELQARKEQYEYYRNLLLNFNHAYGAADEQQKKSVTTWGGHSYEIQWKTLGEIGKFYGGLTGKSKTDFDNGNAKYVTYMNVFNNLAIRTDIKDKVKISINENQNKIEYGDAIFTGSSETPDECGMSSVLTKKIEEPIYLNSFCFGLRFNDKTIFNPEFLKHLLRSKLLREQIKKTANGVTRFNVSKKLFAKIEIPIPPLELQERIVAILDKFETLVNDLSQGLPAEIAAVQEQYEYYRNKLLTFKQVA
ncbi:MAG: restriction endonuclease subunit S [Paludibacteraceae bacterium]|nr:restriction endonuclease subunit S [Paludibacteraceae bacterium]